MSAWWRRNRWFVLSLVALVPIAVLAALLPRAIPYQQRQPAFEEHGVGDTVRYAGSDITLTSLEVLPGWRYDTGDGTDLVVAAVTIDVEEPQQSRCAVDLVATVDGIPRTWDSTLYAGDYDSPEGVESSCSFAEAGVFQLELLFVVPRDVVLDPALELSSDASLPRALRLS